MLSSALSSLAVADIFWVGSSSQDIFDEANWDLSQSAVTAIDPDTSIDDNIFITNAPATVEIPNNGGGQSRLQVGDGYALTIDNSVIAVLGNDGIGSAPQASQGASVYLVNGASVTLYFITNSLDLQVGSGCMARFLGANNPVNSSFIDLAANSWLHFVNETEADYLNEHLAKTTVQGSPAVPDANIGVMTDSASGSIVSVFSDLGISYCGPANSNSTGAAATLGAWGLAEVYANDLTLTASGMPASELGYFLCSTVVGFQPNPGSSQGNLCLARKIGRFVKQVQISDSAGQFSIPVDLTALPVWRNQAAAAGETWHFQAWFKDGKTSNFTDGLSVTFR